MAKNSKEIYVVHAFRWGDRESHSYIAGVYRKKNAALTKAHDEREHRGGKYICEVREFIPGEDHEKVILPLDAHPHMKKKE